MEKQLVSLNIITRSVADALPVLFQCCCLCSTCLKVEGNLKKEEEEEEVLDTRSNLNKFNEYTNLDNLK
jgi:hypothetical protein